MPFTIFTNDPTMTAFANEAMNNWYWIADGTRLPRGGASLEPTDSVFDIGSSTHKFKNLYANNLTIDTAITSTSLILKNAQMTFSTGTTSSRFIIEGLNGDNANYLFAGVFSFNGTATMHMHFNEDSATNYSYRALHVNRSGGYSAAETATSALSGIYLGNDTFTAYQTIWGEIYTKTGNERIVKVNNAYGYSYLVGIWSNTSSTITSISFTVDNGKVFDKLTKVKIWEAP